MNLQAIHYVQMLAGALGAGLPITAAAFPESTRPYFLGAAAVCILVGTTLGVFSKSAKGDA